MRDPDLLCGGLQRTDPWRLWDGKNGTGGLVGGLVLVGTGFSFLRGGEARRGERLWFRRLCALWRGCLCFSLGTSYR
jgi:hypothetical protein